LIKESPKVICHQCSLARTCESSAMANNTDQQQPANAQERKLNALEFQRGVVGQDEPREGAELQQIVNTTVQDDNPSMSIYDHTVKNMRRATQILKDLEFTLKDSASFAIRNLNGRRLHATVLGLQYRSHQMARPQTYRYDGVITTVSEERLFKFLRSFTGNEKAFEGLENRRDLQNLLARILEQTYVNESHFMSRLIELLTDIKAAAKSQGDCDLELDRDSEIPYLALGILCRKSEDKEYLLDTKSGFIGYCDLILKRFTGPFAIMEGKLFDPDFNEFYYRQGGNLFLRLLNSLIGSDSEIGFAVTPGGFYFIWRELVEEDDKPDGEDMPKEAKKQKKEEEPAIAESNKNTEFVSNLKKYQYFTTCKDFQFDRVKGNTVGAIHNRKFYLKVFIQLVRICSLKIVPTPPLISAPESPIDQSTSIRDPPTSYSKNKRDEESDEDPLAERDELELRNVDKVFTEQVNRRNIVWSTIAAKSGDDIEVAAVRLDKVLTTQELEEMYEEYKNAKRSEGFA
jgi:hypothetical protein